MSEQIVISLSAVPDIKTLRVINQLDGLSDEDVLSASLHLHHQQHGHKALPLYQQQIVSVAAVKQAGAGEVTLHHFEHHENDDSSILQQLAALVTEDTLLISWDMNVFDRPLINYQLLKHKVMDSHLVRAKTLSLKEQLSNQQTVAQADFMGLVQSLGLPRTDELDQQAFIDCYLTKQMQRVHDANQCKALNSYLLHSRYQCVSNALSQDDYAANSQALREILKRSENKTLQQFESDWSAA